MTKVELETFVEGTTHYFEAAANQPASVGSPYIVQDGKPQVQEFTGVISIAGKRRGIVYFTASRPMLTVPAAPPASASPASSTLMRSP